MAFFTFQAHSFKDTRVIVVTIVKDNNNNATKRNSPLCFVGIRLKLSLNKERFDIVKRDSLLLASVNEAGAFGCYKHKLRVFSENDTLYLR